ncbi:hypothetical protein GCM10023238_39660 [Streptomyces heliomycini]
MHRDETSGGAGDDVEAVTRAVLTASRLLVAVSARSLTAVEDRVTLPQFGWLVVLSTRGCPPSWSRSPTCSTSPRPPRCAWSTG